MFMPASRTCSSAAAQLRRRGCQADEIERCPDGAAGEHRHAVDVQIEAVARRRGLGRAPQASSRKPTRPAVEDALRGLRSPQTTQARVVQRRLAVGVRPPRARRREPSARRRQRARLPSRSVASSARCASSPDGPRSSTSTTLERAVPSSVRSARGRSTPSSPSIRGRSASSSTASRRAALQAHRPPRPDRGRARRKAGRPAQQHRAEEAQVAVGDQPRAPARARTAALAQQRRERAAADRQLVARSRRRPQLTSSACAANIESLSSTHSPLR